jgi:2-polyprenyl-3-methyl-5-hydroxy-6-metoxy-1,4-benzoquinol methylase
LTAVIDPLSPAPLPHGLDRREVQGVFPTLSGQANSAFAGEIALPADFSAPLLLKIFAELDNGEKHLAFAQRFTPRFHRGRGEIPPLVTGMTFARAVWALAGSARRHGVRRNGLFRAAFSIWTVYRGASTYRAARNRQTLDRKIYRPRDEIPMGAIPALPHNTVIAPADDMYVADAAQYFQIGREALALVQQACALAGCTKIDAILDLPCGHGRVARWLRTAYPSARLAVSDTQAPGVDFCREQLNADGVTASVDGGHWAALPGPYDIIWCGSLLTHFGLEQWRVHLRRFAERLSPHGVLIFTTHGRLALDKLQTGEKDYGLPQAEVTRLCTSTTATGFGYVDYPDCRGYGISVSLPPRIGELIATETELRIVTVYESAWDRHQDVVVCIRRPAARKTPTPELT